MEILIDNDIISTNLIGAIETVKDLKINMEQKILEANNVIIIPHNGVDFDTIGSALGISLLVRKLKKILG